jgi:hypothetical protein
MCITKDIPTYFLIDKEKNEPLFEVISDSLKLYDLIEYVGVRLEEKKKNKSVDSDNVDQLILMLREIKNKWFKNENEKIAEDEIVFGHENLEIIRSILNKSDILASA